MRTESLDFDMFSWTNNWGQSKFVIEKYFTASTIDWFSFSRNKNVTTLSVHLIQIPRTSHQLIYWNNHFFSNTMQFYGIMELHIFSHITYNIINDSTIKRANDKRDKHTFLHVGEDKYYLHIQTLFSHKFERLTLWFDEFCLFRIFFSLF